MLSAASDRRNLVSRPDPHSYYDDTQARTRVLGLKLTLDFGRKVIDGEATLELTGPSAGPMDLDSRGLR